MNATAISASVVPYNPLGMVLARLAGIGSVPSTNLIADVRLQSYADGFVGDHDPIVITPADHPEEPEADAIEIS